MAIRMIRYAKSLYSTPSRLALAFQVSDREECGKQSKHRKRSPNVFPRTSPTVALTNVDLARETYRLPTPWTQRRCSLAPVHLRESCAASGPRMRHGGGVSIVVTAPAWFAAVLAEVDETFIETGSTPRLARSPPLRPAAHRSRVPPLHSPRQVRHPRRSPRRLATGTEHPGAIVTTHAVDPQQWPTPDTALESVHQLTPTAPRAFLSSGLPHYRRITTEQSTLPSPAPTSGSRRRQLPDCGCDACDNGSADLLTEHDDTIRTVAPGAASFTPLGPSATSLTRDAIGCVGSGDHNEARLDPDQPHPPTSALDGTPLEASGAFLTRFHLEADLRSFEPGSGSRPCELRGDPAAHHREPRHRNAP